MSRRPINPELRGLGWEHRRQRARLLARHQDGAPCDWCKQPMYKAPASNPDGMPLEADHTVARSQGGTRADRLLHGRCNRQRGDGTRADSGAPTVRPAWWTRTWYDLPEADEGDGDRIVVLLCGPPGAGKTTAAHASGLTVWDRDDAQWTSEKQFTDALAALASDPHARAVVIRTGATSSARIRAAALIGATHTYLLTGDEAELARRVAHRDRGDRVATLAAIRTWFARHDRDDEVADFPGWDAVLGELGDLEKSGSWSSPLPARSGASLPAHTT